MADILVRTGTPVVWQNAPATGNVENLDLTGASGGVDGVTVGSYRDWGDAGAAGIPDAYLWMLRINGFDAAPTVIGNPVQLYLTQSYDATDWQGPEAPGNTTTTTGDLNRLNNLRSIGAAKTRSLVAADDCIDGNQFQSAFRYWAPVIVNRAGVKLLSTGEAHRLTIIPVYYESV